MIEYLSRPATSRLMKKILRETYPGIQFKIRTTASSICIESTDGPSTRELYKLFPHFCLKSGTYRREGNDQYENSGFMLNEKLVHRFTYMYAIRHVTKEVEEIAFPLLPPGLLLRRVPDGDFFGFSNLQDPLTFDEVVDSVLDKRRIRQYSPTLSLLDIVPDVNMYEVVLATQVARKLASQERADLARLLSAEKVSRPASTSRI
jgi:hypothetical protein